MVAYYNENDPYAAQWLRNLIAAGHIAEGYVDERSIEDVQPEDIEGYHQAHFFAGIGGWSLALRLAGVPDDERVWTGSCPCQAVSSAARGRNVAPDLWPQWRRLIAAQRPAKFFGEQVPRRSWVDQVCNDLETLDYQIEAAILPAVAFGFDHARPRFYYTGHTDRYRQPSMRLNGQVARMQRHRSKPRNVVSPNGLPNRMAVFSAFGNAIVPQVAAAFIQAAYDVTP